MNDSRFDFYCRAEKFFSATLLSYILIKNKFEGLKYFIELVLRKKSFDNQVIEQIINDFDPQLVHYATETNLFRDFSHHGIKLSKEAYKRKEKENTPDVVFVYKEYIFIIECKVYTSYTSHSIEEQLKGQKYIFDMLHEFYNIENMQDFHIAIIPDEMNVSNGIVLTWKYIVNHYLNKLKLIDKNDYVTKVLTANFPV